jgi:anti-sigma regulatory factor (Ser/Thr protein kinase)
MSPDDLLDALTRRSLVTDHVELTLPARPDMLVLARMTVGAVGARAEMAVDDIEDLRLAIDELCLAAVGDHPGGRLELRYDWDDDGIEVSCIYRPSESDGPMLRTEIEDAGEIPGQLPSDLSERILDALVDEHGPDLVGGGRRAWFKKRHERADA